MKRGVEAEMNTALGVIRKRWDDHAQSYDDLNQQYSGREWMKVLKTYLGQNEDIDVVDVGGGTGFLSLYAAGLSYKRCHCVDLSAGMLAIAQKHAGQNNLSINIICSTAENLPFPDNSVDAVINRWLLWTLLEPQVSLKEWRRVLKPNGRLLCFCTVGENEKDAPQSDHYTKEVEDILPLKYAVKETLIRVLQEAGFADVEGIACPQLLSHDPQRLTWYLIKGRKE